MFEISKLDAMIKFLGEEAAYLRKNHKGLAWAEIKAGKFDTIADTIRKVRQNQQMTGISGQRISE